MSTARAVVAGFPDPLTTEEFITARRSGRVGNNIEPVCPWCDSVLTVRADANPMRRSHFLHAPNTHCPTIDAGNAPYQDLARVPADPAQRDERILAVADRIEDIYRRCLRLAPGLSSQEFETVIGAASARNVWSYRDLTFGLIPIVLVLCHERFERRAGFRDEPFFFVLGGTHRSTEDLWIRPQLGTTRLLRVYPDRDPMDADVLPIIPPTARHTGWLLTVERRLRAEVR